MLGPGQRGHGATGGRDSAIGRTVKGLTPAPTSLTHVLLPETARGEALCPRAWPRACPECPGHVEGALLGSWLSGQGWRWEVVDGGRATLYGPAAGGTVIRMLEHLGPSFFCFILFRFYFLISPPFKFTFPSLI